VNEQSQPTWPRRTPIYRLLGLVLSLACGFLFVKAWLRFSASTLEAYYLPTYLKLTLPELPKLPKIGKKDDGRDGYKLVFFGSYLATDEMFLHPPGRLHVGYVRLSRAACERFLRTQIYAGRSLAGVLRWPLAGFGFVFLIAVAAGAYWDRQHNREARDGRLLRGPFLTSRWAFNRRTKGDGLRFRLTNRRNLFEWLQRNGKGKDLLLQRSREAHHIQIAGDTGSGKSTIVRQIVNQIAQRGDSAIIFDPDREYIQEFFNERRGDWVLNPKDERCPYWPIGEEADDEAEATPIAIGFFPDQPTRQEFFLAHTRAIFSYLLATYHPTVNELAYWMAHPEEIDKRVEGTEHEHTITANAAPQRAGILGSLNEAAKPLRMMPSHAEGRRRWSVREWAAKRQGWIFITSTPDTLDALRPMQSLWLDMLILKLQTNEPKAGQPRVWMVLDELASLNALPQLHSALTKQRKSGNPLVTGFQGMSQLEDLYGVKKAEVITSQAFSNFILRTREYRAAGHLSNLIGKAQLERARETTPARWFQRRNASYSSERVIDPVVMESEIQTLDDLLGYFVQRDQVVRFGLRPQPKRRVVPGLIERTIPPVQHRPLDPEAQAATTPAQPVAARRLRPRTPPRPKQKPAAGPDPKQAIETPQQSIANPSMGLDIG